MGLYNAVRSGLTPQEAADRLGVSGWTLLRWEEKGKIAPGTTAGGHRRYDVYELLGNKADATLTVGYARVSRHAQNYCFLGSFVRESLSPKPAKG